MTRIEFIALAESIYYPELGDEWKSQLARDIGVNTRTVQRWCDGSRSVPDIGEQLRDIAAKRAKKLDAQPALAKARAKELRAIAATKSQPD